MPLSFVCDGKQISLEATSIFKEALSFAEDRLREKPQSAVLLSHTRFGFEVEWRDGGKWMVKTFYTLSTIKVRA